MSDVTSNQEAGQDREGRPISDDHTGDDRVMVDWIEEAILADPNWGAKLDPVESRYVDEDERSGWISGRRMGKGIAAEWGMEIDSGELDSLFEIMTGVDRETYAIVGNRLREYYSE